MVYIVCVTIISLILLNFCSIAIQIKFDIQLHITIPIVLSYSVIMTFQGTKVQKMNKIISINCSFLLKCY